MAKKEHTLTLRIPKEWMSKLRKIAEDNYCSVSDVARDILLSEIREEEYEHIFLCEESWKKAVKERDGFQCQQCGETKDIDVYFVGQAHNGHSRSLTRGITLCFSCHIKQNPLATFAENGHSIYNHIPLSWLRKYRQANEQGRIFWERHLACYLTRRKRPLSPIVEWYAETFLREVPEEVLIRTLIEMCPSPDIIANFPSRRYTSPNEVFEPPPLVW